MTDSSTSSFSVGWLFLALLLFFGIFGGGCGNGLFGNRWGGNCGGMPFVPVNGGFNTAMETTAFTDLMALKGCQAGHGNQLERDVLDLKYTTGQQSAVLEQQLETAFRTIISNQDKGFADLRIQQLTDSLNDRNMTLMAQNAEINMLKGQIYNDARFNALERQIESGFCQTIKRPPFYPFGCTPCNVSSTSGCCGSNFSSIVG